MNFPKLSYQLSTIIFPKLSYQLSTIYIAVLIKNSVETFILDIYQPAAYHPVDLHAPAVYHTIISLVCPLGRNDKKNMSHQDKGRMLQWTTEGSDRNASKIDFMCVSQQDIISS